MATLTEKDFVFQEVMAHSAFVKQKCSVFLGRGELLERIYLYHFYYYINNLIDSDVYILQAI
jgi:hypothetical protein